MNSISASFCLLFSSTHGGSDGKHEGTFSIYDFDVCSSSSAVHDSLVFLFESYFF